MCDCKQCQMKRVLFGNEVFADIGPQRASEAVGHVAALLAGLLSCCDDVSTGDVISKVIKHRADLQASTVAGMDIAGHA